MLVDNMKNKCYVFLFLIYNYLFRDKVPTTDVSGREKKLIAMTGQYLCSYLYHKELLLLLRACRF